MLRICTFIFPECRYSINMKEVRYGAAAPRCSLQVLNDININ
jgi:hypothetical protein